MNRVLVLVVMLFSMQVNAAVIDTTATWSGWINNGWLGSGQSFTVDAVDTFFDDITFSFDAASNGKTFNFLLSDGLNTGSTLFSTSFDVNNGYGFIDIDTDLIAGSTVYALIDYNGYSGFSAYYQTGVYAGGNSNFGPNGTKVEYQNLDHVFVANFTEPGQVAEPGMIGLFFLGLIGLRLSRRYRVCK
ncbi:hypothetical protein A9Q99_12865 [Gammaproteobacteria bacterium 45_16_T64]|nr:hypothetical protein A9Q99_12865 [Gammaproteobacteria bacterium 45_16_T64]